MRETGLNRWAGSLVGLHWGMAALIAVVMVLGWVADEYHLSPAKVNLFVWHKSLGITVLCLVLIRLRLRWRSDAPVLPLGATERRLARGVQSALYGCMLLMPLSGWVINSASDFPLKVFWLVPLPALTAPSEEVQELAETVHLTILWITLALLVLHVAAALRHHFIQKDQVLVSMLPVTKKQSRQ